MISLSLLFTDSIVADRPIKVRGAFACGGRLRRRKQFSARIHVLLEIPPLSPSNLGGSVTITLETQTKGRTMTQSLLTHLTLNGVSEYRSINVPNGWRLVMNPRTLPACFRALYLSNYKYRFQGSLGTVCAECMVINCESQHPSSLLSSAGIHGLLSSAVISDFFFSMNKCQVPSRPLSTIRGD
jgi:hypothetical protein